MKSVVVKISGKRAVLLQANDEFIYIPNKNYMIGQVVNVSGKGGVSMKRAQKVLVAAAAFILVLLCGSLTYAYAAPQSYVSLDVNPGIELEVNMFDRIIRVTGINDEGAEILSSLDLKNIDVNEGLELIINQLAQQGYILPDAENSILISVYNNNEESMLTVRERAYKQIENTIREMNMEALLIVVNVDKNTMSQAEELGITAGKLALINAYNDYENTNRTQEELMNMSVYDILSSIEDDEDFFEDEDIKDVMDTISGASATVGPVDTVTGASETVGPDGITGASEEMDDDEYDDEDEHYEDDEHDEDEYEDHGSDERDDHEEGREDHEEEDDD